MDDLDSTSGEIQNVLGQPRKFSPRILILGGTGEGTELASRLAHRPELYTISSLAGRVSDPKRPEGTVRVGGFGGVEGLISFLVKERIGLVVDVTHPFAVQISRNAEIACAKLGLPLVAFIRPPWTETKADLWHEVQDFKEAASLVDVHKRRVLLSIGRQEVESFSACHNAWFLIRAIEEPKGPLPRFHEILLSRGPFDLNDELRLLEDRSIDYIISKNSGGSATYTKIKAAQLLKIPVVMVKRPVKHTISSVETLEEVLMEVDRFVESSRATS